MRSWDHGPGSGSQLEPCSTANPAAWPALRWRRPRAVAPSMASSASVDRRSVVGPPRAVSPPGACRRSGVVSPYSKRGEKSTSSST